MMTNAYCQVVLEQWRAAAPAAWWVADLRETKAHDGTLVHFFDVGRAGHTLTSVRLSIVKMGDDDALHFHWLNLYDNEDVMAWAPKHLPKRVVV